jgi:hypothetical protein
MTLGSTHPLTEMSARTLPWGKWQSVRKADNFTSICEAIFWSMWEPRRLTTLWISTACYWDSSSFFHIFMSAIIGTFLTRRDATYGNPLTNYVPSKAISSYIIL